NTTFPLSAEISTVFPFTPFNLKGITCWPEEVDETASNFDLIATPSGVVLYSPGNLLNMRTASFASSELQYILNTSKAAYVLILFCTNSFLQFSRVSSNDLRLSSNSLFCGVPSTY